MKSFKNLLFIVVFILSISFSVFAATQKSYFIEDERNIEITLDSRDHTNKKAEFSFANYNIKAPIVCQKENIVCHEKMIIHTNIKKEWEIIPILPIWDPELSPQTFANYYPDLSKDQIITDGSDPDQKWIAQKILYERGLLDTFPTGKIGYKTEEAIAKLQYYKGILEVNEQKNIVIIGPKTITELNKLKASMKNPNFTPRSSLPYIPKDKMDPFHQKRLDQIDAEVNNTGYTPVNYTIVPKIDILKPKGTGDVLDFLGEAIIMNKE